jgi:hypothetical protein
MTLLNKKVSLCHMLFPVVFRNLITVVVFSEKYKVTVFSKISCTLELATHLVFSGRVTKCDMK